MYAMDHTSHFEHRPDHRPRRDWRRPFGSPATSGQTSQTGQTGPTPAPAAQQTTVAGLDLDAGPTHRFLD